ncbi:MAG: hypothetical protein VYB40_06475 [Candidatus Thermoplasmatota archaeon]|nr:hypothetical protein [Candidatus Thermoplasmatota archaeon]
MEIISRASFPTWPFMLPWVNENGQLIEIREFVSSRRFTLSYLFTIAALFAWMGYGSTSNCLTREEQIICDLALWPHNIFDAPLVFLISLFTSIWFHNNPDHILLVLVVVVLFLQTAETRIGTRKTMIAMFGVQFSVAIIMSLYLYIGSELNSGDSWFRHGAYGRNYMGGSIGLFGVLGMLFAHLKHPFIAACCYVIFEYWNGWIYHGASMYVIMGHFLAFTLGFTLGMYWIQRDGSIKSSLLFEGPEGI